MTILDDRAAKAIQEAMDARVRALSANHPTTHMAEVIEVDQAGVTWVHIFGGADRTPAIRSLAQVKKGDLVTVTIEDGVVTINGSSSSPAASVEYVEAADYAIAEYAKQAMAAVLGDVLQVKEAIIGRATVEELTAVEAMVQTLTAAYANINELVAGMLTVNDANMMYAKIGLENVNASNVGSAKIRELVAESGWFDDLTVTGDGTITGQLKGVLIDGDTARFQNIYADALKLLGPDGLYHALNMAGLTDGQAQALIDQYGESLDGGLHGSHIIAESVTASQIDVTSLISAMLLAQFVQIGATAGTHIEAKGDRFSFFAGGSGWASLSDDFLYRLVGNPSGNPSEHGWYERVDDAYIPTHDTTAYRYATGETVTASGASGAPLHALTVYGESVQDGIPTPDAPVEIRTVSGVNLLPLTEASVSVNGVHATIKSDGTIELSGTATAKVTLTLNGRNGGDPYGPILPKENYYYTTCEGTTADIWLSVQLKNLSTGGNVYTDNKGTDVSAYRSVDTQLRWVYLQVTSGTNCDGVVLKPAIYQNGKRPWVSYGNLLTTAGKNLIRVQDSTATFTNAYYVQFTATDTACPVSLFELEAGMTYTLSMDVESSVEPFNMSIGCGNGTYARDIASKENNSNGRISITFTPSAAQLAYGKYLAFRAPRYSTTKTFTYSVSNVQLEIGSTATDYEPYRESTAYIDLQGNVLASLPDGTKDVLTVDSTGAATLEKRVGVAVIDGVTVKCNGKTIYGNNVRANITLPGQLNVSSSERLNCYNDRFRISAEPVNNHAQDSSAYSYELYTSFSFAMIPIAALASSDIADINAWFAANPTTVVYPLATPQTIDLGTIDMPAVPDGAEISVTAEVTPTITAEYSGRYYEYTVTSESPLPGEVAYIAVDPITRESTFYMTRSVVVKDLRFGDFKWFARKNRNMALKWIGGDI